MTKRRTKRVIALQNYIDSCRKIIDIFSKKQKLKEVGHGSNLFYEDIVVFDNGMAFSFEDIENDIWCNAPPKEILTRQKEYLETSDEDKFTDGVWFQEWNGNSLWLRFVDEDELNSPDKK